MADNNESAGTASFFGADGEWLTKRAEHLMREVGRGETGPNLHEVVVELCKRLDRLEAQLSSLAEAAGPAIAESRRY